MGLRNSRFLAPESMSVSELPMKISTFYIKFPCPGRLQRTIVITYPPPNTLLQPRFIYHPHLLKQTRYFKTLVLIFFAYQLHYFWACLFLFYFSGGEPIALSPLLARFHFLSLSWALLWPSGMWLRLGWMVLMSLWPLIEPGEVGSPTTGAPLLLTSAEARWNFSYVFSASSPKEVVLTTSWGIRE